MEFRTDAAAERLHQIARDLWDSFLGKGGPYSQGTPQVIFGITQEVSELQPSLDYWQRLQHVIRAVRVLHQGKRFISKMEAKITFERDIPRMQNSAYWASPANR